MNVGNDGPVTGSQSTDFEIEACAYELDAVMVFDGVCHFCSSLVRRVAAADRDAVIRFAPIQSPLGQALCTANGVDPADPTTFLFFDHGRAFTASDGMLALAARLPAPWRWLRGLRIVPRPWRDAAYRWGARRRYRIMGRAEACVVPGKDLRARFLDVGPRSGLPGQAAIKL